MGYLTAMQFFVRSARLGSFSKAAAEAGVEISTVRRQICGLEEDLGADGILSAEHAWTERGNASWKSIEIARRDGGDCRDARRLPTVISVRFPYRRVKINGAPR